jgi:hypothetical protein
VTALLKGKKKSGITDTPKADKLYKRIARLKQDSVKPQKVKKTVKILHFQIAPTSHIM